MEAVRREVERERDAPRAEQEVRFADERIERHVAAALSDPDLQRRERAQIGGGEEELEVRAGGGIGNLDGLRILERATGPRAGIGEGNELRGLRGRRLRIAPGFELRPAGDGNGLQVSACEFGGDRLDDGRGLGVRAFDVDRGDGLLGERVLPAPDVEAAALRVEPAGLARHRVAPSRYGSVHPPVVELDVAAHRKRERGAVGVAHDVAERLPAGLEERPRVQEPERLGADVGADAARGLGQPRLARGAQHDRRALAVLVRSDEVERDSVAVRDAPRRVLQAVLALVGPAALAVVRDLVAVGDGRGVSQVEELDARGIDGKGLGAGARGGGVRGEPLRSVAFDFRIGFDGQC